MNDNENKGAAFHIGDRVSGTDWRNQSRRHIGRIVPTLHGELDATVYTIIEVEDPASGHFNNGRLGVRRDSLRHEPAEQKRPPCDACGAPESRLSTSGTDWHMVSDGSVAHLCHACWGTPGTPDARIVARRKALQGPPPARASADDGREANCSCGHAGCKVCDTKPPEPVRSPNRVSTGYQGYDKPREIAICAEMKDLDEKRLSAMTLRERRKSEALRMIDRPMVVQKYPDGVLWEAFATPGWES